jgi:hypothetical protein
VVDLLRQRIESKDRWANNAILLGDFNVFSINDKTFLALEKAGFKIPSGLKGRYTNEKLDKPFDQIAFLVPDAKSQIDAAKAGVFTFFNFVYRDSDQREYLPEKNEKTYRDWRTYKMSDPLPIWVEFNVDFGTEYLKRKAKAPT